MNNYLNNYDLIKNFSQNKGNEYKMILENKNSAVSNPYNGFIRGNMFDNLYNSYKIREPFEIKPMNEQAELLTYIDSLTFACVDLNLYLDVFPNDREKIELFNQYQMQKKNLLEEYQNKFGSILLNSDSLNTYPWAWNNKPWPWEV